MRPENIVELVEANRKACKAEEKARAARYAATVIFRRDNAPDLETVTYNEAVRRLKTVAIKLSSYLVDERKRMFDDSPYRNLCTPGRIISCLAADGETERYMLSFNLRTYNGEPEYIDSQWLKQDI